MCTCFNANLDYGTTCTNTDRGEAVCAEKVKKKKKVMSLNDIQGLVNYKARIA